MTSYLFYFKDGTVKRLNADYPPKPYWEIAEEPPTPRTFDDAAQVLPLPIKRHIFRCRQFMKKDGSHSQFVYLEDGAQEPNAENELLSVVVALREYAGMLPPKGRKLLEDAADTIRRWM